MHTPDRRINDDYDEERILRELYEEYPDEEEEEVIIGYECLGCGNVQDEKHGCNRCTAFALSPIFE